jgi:hypothetical protein
MSILVNLYLHRKLLFKINFKKTTKKIVLFEENFEGNLQLNKYV